MRRETAENIAPVKNPTAGAAAHVFMERMPNAETIERTESEKKRPFVPA